MVCVRHPCHLLQPSGVDRLASFYCSGFRETETERDGTEQEHWEEHEGSYKQEGMSEMRGGRFKDGAMLKSNKSES